MDIAVKYFSTPANTLNNKTSKQLEKYNAALR